ncbi:MAG: cytochrome c-type biogenesis protein [Vicinamibacteria bacterium]
MLGRSLLLTFVLAPLLISPAHSIQQETLLETQFREISDALVCQCGCNKMLSICDMQGCHSATPMRAEIREKLTAGETKEMILASFVDRLGLTVLSAPPTSGFHLSAWIMPFVVLVAGAWIAKRVLGSWRRQTVEGEASVSDRERAEADAMSVEQQARIERELRDFET